MFGKACHWTLFWGSRVQSAPSNLVFTSTLILFFHLPFYLSSGLPSSRFSVDILYACVSSFMHTLCSSLIRFPNKYLLKSLNYAVLFHPFVTSFSGPDIPLSSRRVSTTGLQLPVFQHSCTLDRFFISA
jgi:hypothetical protein